MRRAIAVCLVPCLIASAASAARAEERVVVVRAAAHDRARADALALALVASLAERGERARVPPPPPTDPDPREGIAEIDAADRDYQMLRPEAASARLDEALARFDATGAGLDREALLRATLLSALARAALGDEAGADAAVDRALAIDPTLSPDPARYPPPLIARLERRREARSVLGSAPVTIAVSPEDALVAIDGAVVSVALLADGDAAADAAHALDAGGDALGDAGHPVGADGAEPDAQPSSEGGVQLELAAGTHVIAARRAGFVPAARRVEVAGRAPITIALALAPDPEAALALAARDAAPGGPDAALESAAQALGLALVLVDLEVDGAVRARTGARSARVSGASEPRAVAEALAAALFAGGPEGGADPVPWIVAGSALAVGVAVAIAIGVAASSAAPDGWSARGAIER